ncbi:MAG: hypothetical protein R3277_04570 [Brumimicrobium sp.]|nr:hypothetical protein [Brumimicrobium sp.]
MKRICGLFILLFLSLSLLGQTEHVLFIGNSFTLNHQMPKKLAQIAQNEGKTMFVDQATKGGMDWQYHATNPVTYQKIKAEPWTYVVLQGKSYEPLLDSATVESTTKKYGKMIIDSIRFYAPNAKIMLFMTWGYKDGIFLKENQEFINYTEMQNRLKKKYLNFADEFNVAVTPVGEIWQQFYKENPGINLYDKDNYHQSVVGSFLVASSFYTMIYQKPIMNFKNLPYTISEMEARKVAEKARDVITNPKYDWRTNNWEKELPDNFALFDYKIKKDSLYLNSTVPEEYDVKWKIDGKTVSKDPKVAIPLTTNEEFEVQIIVKEGILRNRKKEDALYQIQRQLVPNE